VGPIACDVPILDVTIHLDVSELIVDIEIVPRVEVATVSTNPASASPPVIVGMVAVPVPIPVEPGSNNKTWPESDEAQRRIEDTPITPQCCRIVLRNIDHLRLCRFDLDHIGFGNHLLLRRASQSTGFESFAAQTLN